MVKNKRGFLRILEVVIASLIVISAILIIIVNKDIRKSDDICSSVPELLDELAKNKLIRDDILHDNKVSSESFLDDRIKNPTLRYEIVICGLDDPCIIVGSVANRGDICAGERIISTTAEQTGDIAPKKIKLFLLRA